MARLSAPFSLTGTFGELIAYQRKDLPHNLVRTPSTLSPGRFHTDPSYANTRRTASEGGGRSKAAQALRRVLYPLSAVRDHNWQGALTGALTAVQYGDTQSPWGAALRAALPPRPPARGLRPGPPHPFGVAGALAPALPGGKE